MSRQKYTHLGHEHENFSESRLLAMQNISAIQYNWKMDSAGCTLSAAVSHWKTLDSSRQLITMFSINKSLNCAGYGPVRTENRQPCSTVIMSTVGDMVMNCVTVMNFQIYWAIWNLSSHSQQFPFWSLMALAFSKPPCSKYVNTE